MNEIQDLLNQSKGNYQFIRESGLDFESANSASLDYFRALLLKNNKYNAKEFSDWCIRNNQQEFYNNTREDVEYLKKINILVSDDEINYKFRSERAKNTLLSYQRKSIVKNSSLVKLLESVKDDEFYLSLTKDKVKRFENEILTSKEGIERFLTYSSKFSVNDFSNNLVTFLDCVDNKIEPVLLKSQSEWVNTKVDGESVTIRSKKKPLRVLKPMVLEGKIVGYSPIVLYDISQTSLKKEAISFVSEFNNEEILKRLRDSVASSKVISEIAGGDIFDLDISLGYKIISLGDKIAEHYLLSDDEKNIFTYTFAKSLGTHIDLEIKDFGNIKNKIKNALGTLNLVNNELLLEDIRAKHILKENLYLKLGKKDAEVLSRDAVLDKLDSLEESDKQDYQLGLDFSKINLRGSYQISKEILANENISLETNFENLFMVTKKLTINSGDFKGESFVVEDSLSDNEFKDVVAREFLSKLVEKRLLRKTLDVKRINNEFRRNEKLLGREHSDDARRLHDEDGYEKLSKDGERGDSSQISVQQGGSGDGYDKQPDGAGVQRERSLGDGEGGAVLSSSARADKKTELIYMENAGGRIYGSIDFAGNSAKITSVEIKPSLQKRGFGTDLVKRFEEYCFKFRVSEIKIDAHKKSIVFWEKIGFDISGSPQVIDAHVQDYHDGKKLLFEPLKTQQQVNKKSLSSVVSNEVRTDEKPKTAADDYKHLFKSAVFGVFEHTQTHKSLNTMVLSEKLDKEAFIAFNKYLTTQKLGYYSKIAKAFIITDGSFLELYAKKELLADGNGLQAAPIAKSDTALDKEQKKSLSSVLSDEEIKERDISLDLIRNAEFIKKQTGVTYEIRHRQNAVFLTAEYEFSFDEGGRGNYMLRPIDGREGWSVKELWISSGLNRKSIIERINNALEEEKKNSDKYNKAEAVLENKSVGDEKTATFNNEISLESLENELGSERAKPLRNLKKMESLEASIRSARRNLGIETVEYQNAETEIERAKDSGETTNLYYKIKNDFVKEIFTEDEYIRLQEPLIKKINELEREKPKEEVAAKEPSSKVFYKIESLKMLWTEDNSDENVEFSSFEELQKYYEAFSDIPAANSGYTKSKLEIITSNEADEDSLTLVPRVDVSVSEGDFNPLKQNIQDYLTKMYAKNIETKEGTLEKVDFSKAVFINNAVGQEAVTTVSSSEKLKVKSEEFTTASLREVPQLNDVAFDSANSKPEDENFSIEGDISSGGAKTKFKNYIAGIAVMRKIESDEEITADDKEVLSKMPGVGTIAAAFPRSDGSVAKGWENEAVILRETLSEAEYKQAQRATLDAYYTDENIIKAMWTAVDNFGYKGGSVLEPSVGNGRFFGYMPKHLKPNSMLLGVELDKTTSKVAQILYPKAKIYNVGFENFKLLEGQKASLVIGNPPYGQHKITDKSIPDLDGKSIHNYFMGKGIDSLEEGGVMSMVVSSNFLDSSDVSTRAYIGKSANLLGAIRLPKGSFGNANTEIVTDIVFLQKRETGMESNLDDWLHIGEVNDTPINQYFEKNPENLLGIWGKYGTMYRGDEPGLIAREGQDTQLLLDKAIEALPKYINYHNGKYSYGTKAITESSVASSSSSIMWRRGNVLANNLAKKSGETMAGSVRVNSLFIKDDKIYKRVPDVNGEVATEEINSRFDSKGAEVLLSNSDKDRIKGMIKIADVGTKLRAKQLEADVSEGELDDLRESLNAEYDAFVEEWGYLNRSLNVRLFEEDVNAPFLLALEKKYDKGVSAAVAKKNGGVVIKESAAKADIFFMRTQVPYKAPQSASSFEDALNICLSEKSFVDMRYIATLLEKSVEECESYLSENSFVFDDPNDGWVTKEEYLSGNVKEKYKQTSNFRNLEALEGVIPKDIAAIDINVACGASWIPAKDVSDFIKEISGSEHEVKCFYTPLNAAWNVGHLRESSKSAEEFGTKRKDVKEILLAALNNKQVTVYDTSGSGATAVRVVNQDETTAANDKVDLIKEKWSEWIWDSAERRERLGKMYNDKFNVYAKREYDGSHLTLSGKVDDSVIELRPHQKNAVWRALQNGRNLFDHTVGSGKTYSAVASVMELKRTERANKPLVVVPKHLVGQWGKEWLELYPAANILIPSEKDFTPSRRKLLMSRIATGEYDAIIISHDHLGKIENDKDFEIKFIQNQIDEIKDAINTLRKEDSKSGMTVKQWETKRLNLENKLNSLISYKKDDNISFLGLGVDAMVVDEAHEFKNLQFHTSLQRIRGLGDPTGSQKAFDMYIKTQSLLEKTGNKNLIFLTGTPISNTIAEMFTVKRYLMADELKNDGLEHFDAWVKQYADIATDWELAANGKYKLVTRLSKFKNMPELMGSYGTFADIVNIDMVKRQLAKEGKSLDIPAVKDGKPNNIIVERSDDQAEFIGVPDEEGFYKKDSLVYRSEHLPKGKPKKGDDNMLVIMGLARKASLDMRLIDESYEDFKDSKVNKSIEDMLGIYKKWESVKGAQLVFCDLSTPKAAVAGEKERIEKLIDAADKGDEKAIRELEKISLDDLDALNNNFSVYDDIKSKLIALGIPQSEIAFIHDAKSKEQRDELFAKVNSGSIRFLLGSTSKMGAGMNVQKRLVALHHLDVPWRPSDLEQREGRIIRQGNLLFSFYKLLKDNSYSLDSLKNDIKFNRIVQELGLKNETLDKAVADARTHGGDYEVEINRYATKNTLDSGLWEKIEAKASFIAQIKNGDCKDREVEDISGEVANAAEMKAAASGNPLIVEEMKLKTEISKLEAIKKNFNRGLYDRGARIASYKRRIDSFESDKSAFEKDLRMVNSYNLSLETERIALEKLKSDNKNRGISNKDVKAFSGFRVELGGKSFDNREDAGAYIINAGKAFLKSNDAFLELGKFAGFDLRIERYSKFEDSRLSLVFEGASGDYAVTFAHGEQSAGGLSIKLANRLDEMSLGYRNLIRGNETITRELPELEKMASVFPKEAELALLKNRYKVVINELKNIDKKISTKQNAVKDEERSTTKEAVGRKSPKERKERIEKHFAEAIEDGDLDKNASIADFYRLLKKEYASEGGILVNYLINNIEELFADAIKDDIDTIVVNPKIEAMSGEELRAEFMELAAEADRKPSRSQDLRV